MAPSRFVVEQGHLLAFGRAIGAPPPGRAGLAALDPPAPVPPTFVAASALHDPEHLRGLRSTGPLAAPPDGGSLLHAEQHFEYLAPIRVGDVLEVERTDGRRWEKKSRHGGRLRFREVITDYRFPNGALSVRSRMILVETPPAEGMP
ncbi:MaoC family dehydratase N-terminal domain-containing protein [Frankia sp. QA3]|uniref:FAS1-like dehydratase domain-containing protein n=1 Tax=Frankia sp. QA3 TaxID=710111 RepID=UPI000269B6C6|nr:MaoC family dehydratase N-terminal domain-containing protein [Frankia sp. QA3]EIV90880.1 hypothetical protein FraQA3DRAFT_0290 [Frankia sp. QA3]